MDTIQKELLEAVSGLHEIPVGAYNIRTNGKTEARNSTEHIEIIPRESGDGIVIKIKPGTKNESLHIPVVLSQAGLKEKKFPGREVIFRIYLLTLMIPGQVTMIPVFIMMNKAGLTNTYFALIVIILNAFGVFLIRQFMDSVPDELLEAAKVDGCPEYRIFIQIVIPLIKPVLISLVVFTFVTSWNDFLWPLVSTSDSSMYTLTVALSLLKTQYQTNYGLIMAGATVSFLFPFVMYVFLQKQFVEGIALSGIKG